MSENTDTNVENIIPAPTPEIPASDIHPDSLEAISKETGVPVNEIDGAGGETKPQTIQELVANIDISGVSEHEIITDLIAGIQQLALRGTIALGLLARIAVRNNEADAAAADADAEAAQ
jgi:hypothetical protein